MNSTWYLNRLKKMPPAEIFKRLVEHLEIFYSRIKYRNPAKWPYTRFVGRDTKLVIHTLPGYPLDVDRRRYRIFNFEFDLTNTIDWYFSDKVGARWPFCYHSKINYRPGNPYGDVRINWELNRLQFLPAIAVTHEELARAILEDWLSKNPYLYGPGYLLTMEVALRWFSIYWAVCLFKQPLEDNLTQSLAGLALASGWIINNHLSTYSSAGNHLIVEAVGLFWIGKALEETKFGTRLIKKARKILWREICRQINSDGSNQEQSFWYLGFVMDAVYHYLLLEEKNQVPNKVLERVMKMLEFVEVMTSPKNDFPDYGDRDDGYVFRWQSDYDGSPFPGLINIGAFFFGRPEYYRTSREAKGRLAFWSGQKVKEHPGWGAQNVRMTMPEKSQLRTFYDGGMSLMQWDQSRLLFRHARLGLGNTCGHGHADALAVLFSWKNRPILIDLGSGQYNGDQAIRNFFRSTIAHNTIEIGGQDQAEMLGPFLWDKPYKCHFVANSQSPCMSVKAYHTGYQNQLGVIHTRKIVWEEQNIVEIHDSFSGSGEIHCRGAFHLGACRGITKKNNNIEVDFEGFVFKLSFPLNMQIQAYYGSQEPFMGWRSTVYGHYEPIHSILFTFTVKTDCWNHIRLEVLEN